MPLYEYQCDACGKRLEIIRKFSDPPLDRCPACGGPLQKLQSAPAIQFKGSGWYITDYAKKDQPSGKTDTGSKEGAASDKDQKDSGDAKKDATADKPAEKPAASKETGASTPPSSPTKNS